MSLGIEQKGAPITAAQRSALAVAARPDGQKTPSPSLQNVPAKSQSASVASLTLGDIWNGITNFFKSAFQAVVNFIGIRRKDDLEPECAAIAQANNLLPSKENVQKFVSETQNYQMEGALGPWSPAASVKVLQESLNKLGYPIPASGNFDPATCNAILALKRSNNIHQSYVTADGNYAVNEYADLPTLKLIQQKLQTAITTQPSQPQLPVANNPLPENEAIIKQYNLLPTKENVEAFLAQTKNNKSDGTLGPGMNAPADIKELQTILSMCGYQVSINGAYDDATAAAIIKFKKDSGIHENYKLADGTFAVNEYAGGATLAKLLDRAAQESQKNKDNATPAAPETTAKPTPPTTPEAPKTPEQPTPPAASEAPKAAETQASDGGTYTIQNGDSLWKIAQKTLGDGNRWREIYDLNRDVIGGNPDVIHAGKQIKLPGGASQPAPQSSGGGNYTVQQGDSLWKIAQKNLGDGNRWREIYNLNKDKISNPDIISAGMNLTMPGGASNPIKAEKSSNTPAPSNNALSSLSPSELENLGANDKAAFFAALRPAAEEAERQYGVPAALTLAQAALESGWGKHAIGGYNIFGIKGNGPAGTVSKQTQEWDGSKYITITDNFAKYNNFYEAVVEHGKLFHNGYYDKAVNQFAQDHDYRGFVNNIQGIYATSPTYSDNIFSIINQYHLA